MVLLMVALFFASGATALVGEVVWMRMLGLVLGNTVWAATAAVVVWMGGMAVGARLGARLAPRTRHHLRLYGIAEGVIGVFYVLSPVLYPMLRHMGATFDPDLGSALTLGVAQRLLVAGLVLAAPTILMGLTLPLLVERLRGSGLPARVGILYGINTLGAAAGVLATAYVILPVFGERGSLSVAGLACAVVAVVAIGLEARVPQVADAAVAPGKVRWQGWYLVLAALMGAAALAAELVWVRILVLHLGSRVYAFAVLLGVYLLGIALGSLALRVLSHRVTHPQRTLAVVQAAAALSLVVQVVALGSTADLLGWLVRVVHPGSSFVGVQSVGLLAVLALLLPVTVLVGASFPLAVAADPARRSAGAHTGVVAAANTCGGVIGALLAPFVLVPTIGCQRTVLVLVLVHVAVAVALSRRRRVVILAGVAVAGVWAVWLTLPADWVLRRAGVWMPDTEVEVVELDESVSATVLVKRYRRPTGEWLSLELNGVNVASSEPARLAAQQLQGHLPLIQVDNPRRVLHVGFGSGGTCWAVAQHPVEAIDVVEISPEVLVAADTHFAHINHRVLSDPRVRVVVNDGRSYLLATDSTYDVILSDPIHPVYAGNSSRYTVEYFRMCRERLNPGGVVSMWLPLYSLDQESFLRILAAFHSVFPGTAVWYDVSTVNENAIVTGTTEFRPLDVHWERIYHPAVAASLSLAGIREVTDLAADLVLGPREVASMVAEVELHEDDRPFVEYTAGRFLARERTWYDNLLLLTSFRARTSPFASVPVPWRDVEAVRDPRLRSNLKAVRALGPSVVSGM